MGRVFKAFSTNISTRRRRELKAYTLIMACDLFKVCREFESVVYCRSDWEIDIDPIIHSIGRVIQQFIENLNYTRSINEKHYVKTRIRKYIIPVLKVVIHDLKKTQDDNTILNKFQKDSIKKLKSFN